MGNHGHVPVVSLPPVTGAGWTNCGTNCGRSLKSRMPTRRVLFLTNLRHVELVRKALDNVLRARASVRECLQADFIVIDLTEAWKTMGKSRAIPWMMN